MIRGKCSWNANIFIEIIEPPNRLSDNILATWEQKSLKIFNFKLFFFCSSKIHADCRVGQRSWMIFDIPRDRQHVFCARTSYTLRTAQLSNNETNKTKRKKKNVQMVKNSASSKRYLWYMIIYWLLLQIQKSRKTIHLTFTYRDSHHLPCYGQKCARIYHFSFGID